MECESMHRASGEPSQNAPSLLSVFMGNYAFFHVTR